MAQEIIIKQLQSQLMQKLHGCSIDKFTYSVTSWQLRFIHPEAGEYLLAAGEVLVPDADNWWGGLGNLPVNIKDTNESADTIAALCIFTVLNKWPVVNVRLETNGALEFTFANSAKFSISAAGENQVWAWQLSSLETAWVVTCDSGCVYESDCK